MNSSNPGGFHANHAMAIGSARSHTASGFYPRCSTFNDQAIQAHREVSQSVSGFRGRTHRRCVPSAAIQLRPADVPHAPALAPMTPPVPTFAPMVPPAPATPHVPI